MKFNRNHVIAATVGVVVIGAFAPAAFASPPSGVTPTVLVTANLNHTVHIRSDGVHLATNKPTDVQVQNLVFAAGSSTGWHHHPGLVVIAVQSGTITFWNSHCKATSYAAGAVVTESGDRPGQFTSAGGATTYATLIAPHADPPVFRIEDDPPRCAARAAVKAAR